MEKYIATLTQRGRVTLPAEVRRVLGVKPGDRIEFIIDGDHVTVAKSESFTAKSAARSIKPLAQPMDFDEMIRIAKEDRVDDMMRQLSGEE